MSQIWSGLLNGVVWPENNQQSEQVVDLAVELWLESAKSPNEELVERLLRAYSGLEGWTFVEYTNYVDLRRVCGPELVIRTRTTPCAEYFGQLANSGNILLARPAPPLKSSQNRIEQLAMYLSLSNGRPCICARPLSAEDSITAMKPAPSVAGGQAGGPARRCVDALVPQTVSAALRLRGMLSTDHEFMRVYSEAVRAARFALRHHKAPVALEEVKEKVEAIIALFTA